MGNSIITCCAPRDRAKPPPSLSDPTAAEEEAAAPELRGLTVKWLMTGLKDDIEAAGMDMTATVYQVHVPSPLTLTLTLALRSRTQ
jgi:hypothetical protein